MAGIGKYKKGAKFTLKSGNSPAFKMIGTPEPGDSPITNEFGIGKGTSPYKQGGVKKAAKFVAGLGTAILTGGLDAAYGSGKIIPTNPYAKEKADDEEAQANSPEENIKELTNGADETKNDNPPSETNMKNFAIGSDERKAEYDRRGWKYDETIEGYNRDGTKIK